MIFTSASMQGAMHKQYSVANQDRAAVWEEKGAVCAVLCDGVSLNSNYQFSHSEIAASFCVRKMKELLSMVDYRKIARFAISEILPAAFEICDQALDQFLIEKEISRSDCMTTMIALIYRKGRLYAGIAGDGGILYERRNGSIAVMNTRMKTTSMVYPLKSRAEWKFFDSQDRPGAEVCSILAATDGVFDSILYLNAENQTVLDLPRLKELFALSSVPRKRRQKAFREMIAQTESADDLSAVLIENPKYFPRTRKSF